MARKNSIKTATWTDLDEIRSSLPGISLDDARAMLHASRERFLSSDELAAHNKAHVDALAARNPWSSFKDATAERESFAAPVFAARDTRRSNESSDHTLRLSNSRNDSAALKKFLETKSITVVPTRTAPGATGNNKVRVGSTRVSSTVKSQKAHAKVSRDAAAARRS
jgi:hypothetical protein